MKKLFFSLVMMLALVIVAGSAMAQTSLTPYKGGTYSYTMTGIDDVGNARTARVFIDTNLGIVPEMTVASKYTVTSLLTVSPATNYFDIALPASTTELNFSIAYDAAFAVGTYQLYVVLYDGDATKCYNFIYRTIVVTANNFDLAVTPASASVCQTINAAPAVNTTASASQTTVFTYVVTKTGGDVNDDWSFDFDIPSNGLGLDIDDITNESVAITAGAAATNSVAITGTLASGNYNVKVTNTNAAVDATEVTISITVTTTTGSADAAFAGTVSAASLYTNQTANIYNTTETNAGNNARTTTLKNLPSIGTFVGN